MSDKVAAPTRDQIEIRAMNLCASACGRNHFEGCSYDDRQRDCRGWGGFVGDAMGDLGVPELSAADRAYLRGEAV